MIKKSRVLSFTLSMTLLASVVIGCAGGDSAGYKHLTNKATDGDGVYTDLGNYVIELAEYQDADYDACLKALDEKYGQMKAAMSEACTACAKHDSEGNVLIGRNLDNQVSQCPAFLIHSTQGKYETVSLRYMNSEQYTYETFKTEGYLDKDFLNSISFCVTDSMNSEGLYIQANVREPYPELINTGTNPGKQRLCVPMLVAMVSRNCATVKEALDYLRNDVDIYSTPYINETVPTQYGYYIGDATGEFGVIEIAANEVNYIPYASAQGNYYITPKWIAFESNGAGYGRVQAATDGLSEVTDMKSMLEHMEAPMWKNEVLYMDNAYLDENGKSHFVDDDGNPTIDFRSDFSNQIPLDENGNLTDERTSETIARSNARWMMDDKNFDIVKEQIGNIVGAMGWKEKLEKYYAGDEKDLRDDGNVFTTGASFSVNCKEKTMLIKFWENDNDVYEIKMK